MAAELAEIPDLQAIECVEGEEEVDAMDAESAEDEITTDETQNATVTRETCQEDSKIDTSKMNKQYDQKYRKEWETLDAFKDWLTEVPGKDLLAWCRICEQSMRARRNDLTKHSECSKHRANTQCVQLGKPINKPSQIRGQSVVFRQYLLAHPDLADWLSPVPNNRYRCWCKYCACTLTPQRQFLVNHAKSRKHLNNRSHPPQPPPQDQGRDVVGRPAGNYVLVQHSGSGLRVQSTNLIQTRSPASFVNAGHRARPTSSTDIGNRKVGFIGAGQIAQSLAGGFMEQGLLAVKDVMVSAPSERNIMQWKRWNCRTTNDNDEVFREADIIFLAVKSSVLASMISKLSPVADGKTRLVISVVPGVTRDRLIELLETRFRTPEQAAGGGEEGGSHGFHVVRTSLNQMVSISEGFCAYCMSSDLPHALYLVVETMFSAVGMCVHVEESLMDAYSTMVSSGAAFTCAFIEAMVQGGVNQNIPWEEALMAAATVVSGTSELLIRSGLEPSALRKAIATPGGSTIAALNALHRGGLDDAVVSAMDVGCNKTTDTGNKV